jgi:hypothetical protein
MTESCLTHLEHELMVSGPSFSCRSPAVLRFRLRLETAATLWPRLSPLLNTTRSPTTTRETTCRSAIDAHLRLCLVLAADSTLRSILADQLTISRRSLPAAGQLDNLIYHTSAREENQGDLAEESYPPSN